MRCTAWFSRSSEEIWLAPVVGLALTISASASVAQGISVNTYHNDTLRTGRNSREISLTSSVVGGGSFGLLHQVALDAQVGAQPLIVAGLSIGGATHDVAYIATEGNTVYAIDASSGEILKQTNLGSPAPLPAI